jgi:subtilisin family serine protease
MADYVQIGVPEGTDANAMKKQLEALPDVESVEFDVIRHIAGAAATPNDPYFLTYQYPLRNTGLQPPADHGTSGADAEMQAAWNHTTGDSSVILAIIDTGIDFEHPDLADRIWYNLDEGLDGIDEDGNNYASDWRGWNFVANNNDPDDDHSHGSHCAGIAGAATNNGIGVAGTDWKCKLMALKSLSSSGSGSSADVAEAIYYAANNGADVISMSLGSYGVSGDEEDAVDYAYAAGVIVFAATGNDNVATPHFPAAFPNVVAVGATDSDDRRALPLCGSPGSNYGDYIDICAAGNWIWSTVPIEDGSYAYKCGTSMATPHAAGLAALIKSLRPDFTPDEVRALMQVAAEDQVGRPSEDTPGFDTYHGWGRINGRIALQALTTDYSPILALPAAQVVTELETLEFTVSASDSNFTVASLTAGTLANAAFVDSGNGVGVFSFSPDLTQQGVYQIEFVAGDGGLADTGLVTITVLDGCLCPSQGDFDSDNFITSIDLASLIDVLFSGGTDIIDPWCSTSRGDLDCDAFATALDLAVMIDHLFSGGPPPCDPCAQ